MPRTGVQRKVGRTAVAEAEPGAERGELTPVYAAALLKVAMELKRPDARGIDELLAQILEGLRVDPQEFKAYLARNFSLLQATAKSRAY